MTMTAARIGWADTARGIGIILVVYGHVMVGLQASPVSFPNDLYRNCFQWIWSFHMHLFFFLAGFFAYKSLEKTTHREFIIRKFHTIAYPYLVWSAIQGLLQFISRNYTNSSISIYDIINIFYIPLPGQHFWFIYVLFIFFVSFAIFNRNKYGLLSLYIISVSLYFFPVHSNLRIIQKVNQFFLFFMLGVMYFQINGEKFIVHIKNNITVYKIFVIVMTYAGIYLFLTTQKDYSTIRLLISLQGIFLILHLSLFFEKYKKLCWLNFVGKYSLQIYLMHSIFLAASRIVLLYVFKIDALPIHIVSGTICGLMFPLIIGFYIKQYNVRYVFQI
jgi:fucose 4-O-acetylase-like acetyltransferase